MNIVIPVRKGGLGNQMFQVAAALIYSKETNKTVVLPLEDTHIHHVHPKEYEQSIFKEFQILNTKLDLLTIYALRQNGFVEYPGEPTFNKWEPIQLNGSVILQGYFQYYPPIEKYKDLIVNTFLNGLSNYKKEGNKDTVGIHVRRGDYLKFPDVFPLLGGSYYLRAIRQIDNQIGKKYYRIFSDDINWCKEQEIFQSLPNVEFVDEQDEIKCLCEMISCEAGFICANSSFSWWAAFLGAFHKGGICIASQDWCKDFTGDLIPKEWISIPKAEGNIDFFEPGTLNLHQKKEYECIIKPLKEKVELYSDTTTYINSSLPKVFLQLEPSAIKNMNEHLLQNYSCYDKIYTFHQTVLDKCPNAVKIILPACTWISGNQYHTIDTTRKQFKISCITGSKQLAEGHKYRLLLYFNQNILLNKFELPITFYRSSADTPLPELSNNPFIYKDKFPLFETYQFSIVIENSSQPNYFTEKLIDCLITKTIPIYYGCPNISEYFDTTGWILLKEPNPEDRLSELINKWKLRQFNADSYRQYQDTIEKNYKVCKEKYSGFYTKINQFLLDLPSFQ